MTLAPQKGSYFLHRHNGARSTCYASTSDSFKHTEAELNTSDFNVAYPYTSNAMLPHPYGRRWPK